MLVRWAKVPATKPEDMVLMPYIDTVEGENSSTNCPLKAICAVTHIHCDG